MRPLDLQQKPRRPGRAWALALVVVLGGLFLFGRAGQGRERLAEFSPGGPAYPAGVFADEVFVRHSAADQTTLDIRAMPLRGGKARPVFRAEQVHDRVLASDSRALEVTRTGLYYTTRDETRDASLPPGAPSLPRPVPLPKPHPRPPTHRTWERRARMRMWRVPLAGGAPLELFPDRPAIQRMVVGDYCYWLESELLGPGKPLVTPIDKPPRMKLVAAPLSGGAPREIAELQAGVRVMSGSHGVFWATAPGVRGDLVYTRAPDFSLTVIPDVYGSVPPREIGDRFYWLDGVGDMPANGMKRLHQVVSVAADGSDRRVDVDVARRLPGESMLSELRDDGHSLFVERSRIIAARGAELPKLERHICLVQLRTGELRPLILVKEDENLTLLGVDGGYAYYAAREWRDNWLDWSTNGLKMRWVQQLFRVRISQ